MKKNKILHVSKEISLFKIEIDLIIWNSEKTFTDPSYPNFEIEEPYACSCAGKFKLDKNGKTKWGILILLTTKAIKFGIIAHEATHAANQIFERINYNFQLNNDEIQAYTIEYIVDWIIFELNKAKFNISIK